MTPTDGPTRPDDVADVPLRVLTGTYADNMLGWHCFGGKGYALAALADGTAITQRIAADQWPTALVALTGGATLTDVSVAMCMDPINVRIGLIMWARGRVSDTRFEEIVSLLDGEDDTSSEPGPR